MYKEICNQFDPDDCENHIIKYLPRNTKIVFKEIANTDMQNYFGINAPMVKVSVDNTLGFVFSGLLSKLPTIPMICNNFQNYVESNYRKIIKKKEENWCISEYGEHCGKTLKSFYNKDIVYATSTSSGINGKDIRTKSIINLNVSLHEAFLIALNCSSSEIKNYQFDKFERDAIGWHLESNNPTICEYDKNSDKPLKSVYYQLRFSYNENRQSEITITRNINYSDNCK